MVSISGKNTKSAIWIWKQNLKIPFKTADNLFQVWLQKFQIIADKMLTSAKKKIENAILSCLPQDNY